MVLRRSGSFSKTLVEYSGLCDSGRSALYYALLSARLPRDTVVWMPSFHCGVEVDAAISAGCKIDFYRVAPDLSCDMEDLDRKLREKPGPVLLIHYFGFPQPCMPEIVKLCNRHGVLLIEDCAHALFSRGGDRYLGQYGALAIFSLRKSLPLLEGGAYLWNGVAHRTLSIRDQYVTHCYFDQYKLYFKELVRQLIGQKFTELYRSLLCGHRIGSPGITSRLSYRAGLSDLTRRLAAMTEPCGVVECRRRNWEGLDARLSGKRGYRKVFRRLQDGVCPLFLPAWVNDRPRVMAQMREQQIEAFGFGAVAHPRLRSECFPGAEVLRGSILCLPIHQQLRDCDLDRIAAVFAALLEEDARLPALVSERIT